jgi:hypothetical protein
VDTLSFTTSTATAAIYNTHIYQYAPTTNYGTVTTTLVGIATASREYKSLLWLPPLDDTIKAIVARRVAAGGILTIIDSGLVTYHLSAEGLGTGETETIEFYKVKVGWDEDGVTWNTIDGIDNWGTAGCNNTTSDRSATTETIVSRSATTVANGASAGDHIIVPISGTSVSDTLTDKGYILTQTALSGGDGLGNITLKSDDDATASNRPSVTVYYRNMYPVLSILNARASKTLVGVRATNTGSSARAVK